MKKNKVWEFLTTDIKLINNYLLTLIVLVTISVTSLGTYAIFTYTKVSDNLIKIVYQPSNSASLFQLKRGTSLSNQILGENNNNVVTTGDGLYMSTETNDGSPTYYYKGNISTNVSFAGLTWNVIRINEDGTIRMILAQSIGNYFFSPESSTYYYSETDIDGGIKKVLDTWYNDNLLNYESSIATTPFCEAAKTYSSDFSSHDDSNVEISEYIASFTCPKDAKGKQYVEDKIGLLSIDERILMLNNDGASYLSPIITSDSWTMSPAGYDNSDGYMWVYSLNNYQVANTNQQISVYPVINLNADVIAICNDGLCAIQ